MALPVYIWSGLGGDPGTANQYCVTALGATPTAGRCLVAFVALQDTTKSVTSWTDDAPGGPNPWVFRGALNVSGVRIECWSTGINDSLGGGSHMEPRWTGQGLTPSACVLAEYSGVLSLGSVVSASGAGANPSISKVTVDNDNFLAAGFASVGATLATALTGNMRRSKNSGGASPVVATIVDNTAALASSVSDAVTLGATQWAALALELRSVAAVSTIKTVGPAGRDYTTVQAAIDAAVAGDTIKCDANVLFAENLTLRNKGVLATPITITTNAAAGSLPATGVRTSPAFASFMPRIQSPGFGLTTVATEAGANGYVFRHIEFPEVPQGYNSIITLGQNDSSQQFYANEPYNITVDQCYLHGGTLCGQKRGIETHGRNIAITNNWISDIKSVGQDSNAIMGNNGHGPLTVINNVLNGGTEPFLLGGSDPPVRTLMTVTGTPTTTSADVTCTEAAHTLAELVAGQAVAIMVGGVYLFTTITGVVGTGTTGTITFTALSGVPDVPGNIKAGVVLGMQGPGYGLIFQKNWVYNTAAWINGVVDTPTGVGIVGDALSGTLAPGNYYYTIQAFCNVSYQGNTSRSAQSAEVSVTLLATGKVTLSWNAVTGATSYRIWRGSSSGVKTLFKEPAGVGTTYVDDGTALTGGSPSSASVYSIKNLFELKAAQNCQIDSNIFENCWKGVDVGYAWWLKSVNQSGGAPWVQTKNVTLELNIIRHCFGFLEVHGRERGLPAYPWPGPLTNLTVRNNLIYDSSPTWSQGANVLAMAITEGVVNMTLDHNTLIHTTYGLLAVDSAQLTPLLGLVMTNNMFRKETYGIHDATGEGVAALNVVTSGGYTFSKNAIADATNTGPGAYGPLNLYEASALWVLEFVAYVASGVLADFHLTAASPYKLAGLDGKDLGCDIDRLLTATQDVLSGVPSVGRTFLRRFGR